MESRFLPYQIIYFVLLSIRITIAQQFDGYSSFVEHPGFSQACIEALNTTISCPPFLSMSSVSNERLESDQLDGLCVDSCKSSLNAVRSTISSACKSNETVVYNDIAYPATYVTDAYIYYYDISCLRDSSSGEYCDLLFAEWDNQTAWSQDELCSDCWLGLQSRELSSPLGYDDGFAEAFSSMTMNCSATGYGYATPTPIGLNGTATALPPSSTTTEVSGPTCTATYTVQNGDSCNTVAQANNVSTFSLMYANGLSTSCLDFPDAGAQLCLPSSCSVYNVSPGDTCITIAQANGITLTQLKSWNPDLNLACNNLVLYNYICVSPPGGTYVPAVPSNTGVSTALSAVPAPTNALEGSNRNCGKWYTIQEGDTCSLVSVSNYIGLPDFYFLNPEINANCTNLELGEAYCIAAVGDISTYSGYPVTATNTLSIVTGTFTPVQTGSTTTTSFSGTPVSETMLPMAPGTSPNCYTYRNYADVDADSSNSGLSINSCAYIAMNYVVGVADLLSWNPSLSSDACSFKAGYSYCVQQSSPSAPTTDNGFCISVNDTQAGTIDSCSCYTTINGYSSGDYTCDDLASDYSITVANIIAWNSWVGSDCSTGLFADLADDDQRAVCIGVNASAPTQPATNPPTTVTTSGSPVGPTQTGGIANCQQYHTVQSGDSCSAIEAQYAITFEQFYAMNPSVGSNCENLWLGYAYCVMGPSTTTTSSTTTSRSTTATKPTPTSPTQTGIASSCSQYYTIQSGDSCTKIESDYNISFDQLYKWNPAIGSNCQSLWVGYAVCVLASS